MKTIQLCANNIRLTGGACYLKNEQGFPYSHKEVGPMVVNYLEITILTMNI